jgi:hypothetical protein
LFYNFFLFLDFFYNLFIDLYNFLMYWIVVWWESWNLLNELFFLQFYDIYVIGSTWPQTHRHVDTDNNLKLI